MLPLKLQVPTRTTGIAIGPRQRPMLPCAPGNSFGAAVSANSHPFAWHVAVNPTTAASWRSFCSGVNRLRAALTQGWNDKAVAAAFEELQQLWRQSHHVRALGAYLLDRAGATGGGDLTLGCGWRGRRHRMPPKLGQACPVWVRGYFGGSNIYVVGRNRGRGFGFRCRRRIPTL